MRLAAYLATAALCMAATPAIAANNKPTPQPVETQTVKTVGDRPSNYQGYSSGLSQQQLDDMFKNQHGIMDNQTAYTEGGPSMQTHDQKHFSVIAKGKYWHHWAHVDEYSTVKGDISRERIPGDNYTGDPVSLATGDTQHFIGRTSEGFIKHHIWTPDGGRTRGPFHHPGSAPHIAHDPAAGWMSNQLHLFYVDRNGELQHRWSDDAKANWSHSENWTLEANPDARNVKLIGKPSIFQWHNQQHVMVRTTDHRLAHFYWYPGSNGVLFSFWNSTPAASDPVTLSTPGGQSVFYNDVYGHLQRVRWNARENKTDDYNWSKAHSSEPIMAVGRPQVFEAFGQEHAVLRHIDHSVSHTFKSESDTKPKGGENFGPSTTRQTVTAARLFDSQDIFIVKTDGTVLHRLWRPRKPSNDSHFVYREWGKVTAKEKKWLPNTARFTSNTTLVSPDSVVIADANNGSAVFLSDCPWPFPDSGDGVLKTECNKTTLRNDSARFHEHASVWIPQGGEPHMTGTNIDGDVTTLHRKLHDPSSEWRTHRFTVSASGANGPLTSTNTNDPNAKTVGHVVHTKHGILFAASGSKDKRLGPVERLRWKRIHHGWLDNKNVSIQYDGQFHVQFINNAGRVVTGSFQPDTQYVTWQTMPAVFRGQKATGLVAAATQIDGGQRLVVRGDDGRVYTIGQDMKGGAKFNNYWDWDWLKISDDETKGNPILTTLTNGQLQVATRNRARRLVIAKAASDRETQFTEFKTFPGAKGEVQFIWDLTAIVDGKAPDGVTYVGKSSYTYATGIYVDGSSH